MKINIFNAIMSILLAILMGYLFMRTESGSASSARAVLFILTLFFSTMAILSLMADERGKVNTLRIKTFLFIVRHPIDSYWLMRADEMACMWEWGLTRMSNYYDVKTRQAGKWHVDYAANHYHDIVTDHLSHLPSMKVSIWGGALRDHHGWYMRAIDVVTRQH